MTEARDDLIFAAQTLGNPTRRVDAFATRRARAEGGATIAPEHWLAVRANWSRRPSPGRLAAYSVNRDPRGGGPLARPRRN